MRSFFVAAVLASASAASASNANFTVSYPPPRSDNSGASCYRLATDKNAPLNSTVRTAFPLNGTVPFIFTHGGDNGKMSAAINWGADPGAFTIDGTEANVEGNKTKILTDTLVKDVEVKDDGKLCSELNLTPILSATGEFTLKHSLGETTPVANGTEGILYVTYKAGDDSDLVTWCSDIVLVSDYAVPSSVTCQNTTSGALGAYSIQGAAVGGMAAIAAAVVGGLF